MKFLLILFAFGFLSSSTSAQYNSPESITYDSLGKRYLVSNTSSSKIVQRDLNGNVTDFVTVGGSIHGVTVHNGKAYVCNGTRVRGYDLTSATEVFNVLISGSTFLNDLAIDNSGMIYVSDFTTRRIYKLNSNNSEYWIYIANTTNTPNGVYVDTPRNRLLICCWGSSAPVKAVSFADSSIVNLITTPYSNCDGISLDRNDNVYISTWGIQSVVKYDINFSSAPTIAASSLSNPADIYVNKWTDTLAIPNASNSTVTFVYLNLSAISNEPGIVPDNFRLHQNFPNPFNPSTKIVFDINKASDVKLVVFDANGRQVEVLVDEKLNQGKYSVNFRGENFPSGTYFYKLTGNNFSEVRKFVLLK